MIVFCGICGAETGDFFHPRFIGRKYGVCGPILITVLAVCKEGLKRTFAAFKILDIITPPITDSLVLLGNTDSFDITAILLIVLHMFLFSLAVMLIKVKLLKRFGYRM